MPSCQADVVVELAQAGAHVDTTVISPRRLESSSIKVFGDRSGSLNGHPDALGVVGAAPRYLVPAHPGPCCRGRVEATGRQAQSRANTCRPVVQGQLNAEREIVATGRAGHDGGRVDAASRARLGSVFGRIRGLSAGATSWPPFPTTCGQARLAGSAKAAGCANLAPDAVNVPMIRHCGEANACGRTKSDLRVG